MNRLMALPAVGIAVALLVVLGLTVQEAAANMDSVKTELDANKILIDKKTSQKKELTNSIASLESQLAGLEASRKNYTAALNSLTTDGQKMNEDFTVTLDNVVTDLDLARMMISGNSVTVDGRASSEQEVFQYVRKLTATGRFDEITIASLAVVSDMSENDTLAMNYSLIMKLKAAEK